MFGAEALLAGPRGRRLCFELRAGSPDLFSALTFAVANARYWQPPDETDVVAAAAVEELREVAERVLADPASAWWTEPLQRDDQHFVHWSGTPDFEAPADDALQAWYEHAVARERRVPDSEHSGEWWSTPSLSGCPSTTRSVDGMPVRVNLVEDQMGWNEATSVLCAVDPDARVYEIDSPAAWTALVERYPMVVTRSRRWDWYRTTGVMSGWLMPDWRAVAADYDAAHLSAAGYLETAGRALPIGDLHTVLAGWDPDQTWWLRDVLRPTGPIRDWRVDNGDWLPA